MEYMNRAERRRAKRQGEKVSKPPVYNYTPGTLRNQLDYEAKHEPGKGKDDKTSLPHSRSGSK